MAIETVARYADASSTPTLSSLTRGGDRMRGKPSSTSWRSLLYTAASLATLLFAAGAKWKPH
jgi:hypothetical protein